METLVQTDQGIDSLTSLFRLLSDRTRVQLLFLLAEGERNVTQLCNALQLPQPTVSHHLGLLRAAHLIDNRRSGKQVFYALNGRVSLHGQEWIEIAAGAYTVKLSSN